MYNNGVPKPANITQRILGSKLRFLRQLLKKSHPSKRDILVFMACLSLRCYFVGLMSYLKIEDTQSAE